MKKTLKLCLTGLCCVGFAAACSSSDTDGDSTSNTNPDVEVSKEGFPIVEEEITLSLMAPGTGLAEWKDMPTLQEYSEMTNISFEYTTPPMSDFATRLNLAFASGDVADIIYGAGTSNLTPGMEVDYGRQGILIPLEDLIAEYAPNIQRLLDENPDIARSITTVDGHIYSLPVINQHPNSSWAVPMWYNGEWLDALDAEVPTTTDELYDLLVRFRDEDPNGNGEADEIPLLDVQMNSTRLAFLGAFGMKAWGIEEVDGEVRYAPHTENYKEYLTYMNKLFEEGLLDPETFSQSDEQKKAKGQENRLGLFPDWFSFFTTGQSEDEAMNNPMFHALSSPITDEPLIPINPGITRGTFAITSNNEYPEASIRWVDYFYSDEGSEFLDHGPEGYLFERDEDGNKVKLDPPPQFDSAEDYRGTLTPAYGIPTPTLVKRVEGVEVSEFDQFLDAETEEKIGPYGEVPIPLLYLTNEEQEIVNTIEVDLKSYVEQLEARFITGVEPLSNWDKYVDTIESMNIEEYIEIYQVAYDRWASS
ncbi:MULTISPECIES: extracellular solute-binding protein [Bacillaceae]|uniref:ABC transporter substrate-binding protein n=1 Tax=Alkalicoccobacillus plakortidis TaxID=444060 RepID=A0A9D5DX79_9BACI|nr:MULTISPECIES: extracellular solute-binding protein [Bacillaceae]KQL58584.1 ABC transporter substrate-binding protein [Alkalicoccobacillus plakortidis]RQW22745.1 extracellular solute-binding protein [Bacillus sp. C1-1]